MEMANFKPLQMQLLEDVLQMGGGFVLKFSDRTFAEFFREELAVDIDDPKYSVGVSGCSTRNLVAVCWPSRRTGECGNALQWCTYKRLTLQTRPDGSAPGEVFVCN